MPSIGLVMSQRVACRIGGDIPPNCTGTDPSKKICASKSCSARLLFLSGLQRTSDRKERYSFCHASIHEFIPASQLNFLCPSLLFTARPFFATLFFRGP